VASPVHGSSANRRIDLQGRRAERTRLRRLFPAVPSGLRVVVLQGEPGIGKTSLWLAALDMAQAGGYRVLTARPAQPEERLSYGVLLDLLDGLFADDAVDLEMLPRAQREALTAIRDGAHGGVARAWQVVGAALLSILRVAADAKVPLVIGIDDIQWADRASTRVLGYALRRAATLPIRVIATERISLRPDTAATESFVGLEHETWRLEPMLRGDLVIVLRHRLRALLPEVADSVAEASGANPFIALEMGRAALERGGPPVRVGHAPISRRLHRLAADRVTRLDDAGLEVALLSSVLSRPTTSMLELAAGSAALVRRGLASAETAGVLELRGDIWAFTHPLLAAAVYDSATAPDRRALHARMAAITPEVEERAWHLALAATGPDSAAAAALGEAAEVASARGAPDSALALLIEAIRLTSASEPDLAAVRRVAAARALFALDRLHEALDLATTATGEPIAAPTRGAALELCGYLAEELVGPVEAFEYLDRALDLTTDPARAIGIAELRAELLSFVGRSSEVGAALQANLDRAEAVADVELIGRTRANLIVHDFQSGRLTAIAALSALERLEVVGDRLHEMVALVALWADRPDLAFEHWAVVIDRAEQNGDEHTRAVRLAYRSDLDLRVGDLDRAAATLRDRLRVELAGDQLRAAHLLFIQARLAAIRGDARMARSSARRAMDLGAAVPWYIARSHAALGLLDLSRGDAAAAVAHYEAAEAADPPLLLRRHGAYYISIDRIEAQAASGARVAARSGLDRLAAQAAAWQDGWLEAGVARARAAVLAAEGDLPAALEAAAAAVERYESLPYPLDLGRAFVALGAIHRRLSHRRDARLALGRAALIFRSLGAQAWLERVTGELARIGGRAPSADELTPSETAVADLVARGLTNAEVAGRLFLTTRTVESHLTQVYAKLGLRSRTELANVRRVVLSDD
jgi:DNA-binding NarL/FixJ family response regulator